jgi:peroxiredoxin Q/BCP
MPISAGIPAPEFKLIDQDGKEHTLSDYKGKPLLLYFYPRDDTPGCTKEACNFRDDYSQYEQAGVTILGVSPDDAASHV